MSTAVGANVDGVLEKENVDSMTVDTVGWTIDSVPANPPVLEAMPVDIEGLGVSSSLVEEENDVTVLTEGAAKDEAVTKNELSLELKTKVGICEIIVSVDVGAGDPGEVNTADWDLDSSGDARDMLGIMALNAGVDDCNKTTDVDSTLSAVLDGEALGDRVAVVTRGDSTTLGDELIALEIVPLVVGLGVTVGISGEPKVDDTPTADIEVNTVTLGVGEDITEEENTLPLVGWVAVV